MEADSNVCSKRQKVCAEEELCKAVDAEDTLSIRRWYRRVPLSLRTDRLLIQAIKEGKSTSAMCLLECGAVATTPELWSNMTALHYAAKNGDMLLTQMLLARGADINHMAEAHRYTPLFYALQAGHLVLASWLYERKARLYVTSFTRDHAQLPYAARSFEAFFNAPPSTQAWFWETLQPELDTSGLAVSRGRDRRRLMFEAVCRKDSETLSRCLTDWPKECPDEVPDHETERTTCLYQACALGSQEMVLGLLPVSDPSLGQVPRWYDGGQVGKEENCLMCVVRRGDVPLVKLLLKDQSYDLTQPEMEELCRLCRAHGIVNPLEGM